MMERRENSEKRVLVVVDTSTGETRHIVVHPAEEELTLRELLAKHGLFQETCLLTDAQDNVISPSARIRDLRSQQIFIKQYPLRTLRSIIVENMFTGATEAIPVTEAQLDWTVKEFLQSTGKYMLGEETPIVDAEHNDVSTLTLRELLRRGVRKVYVGKKLVRGG